MKSIGQVGKRVKMGWVGLLAAVSMGISIALAQGPVPTGQGMVQGAPFGDHAVLQRAVSVPVWGWSTPGTEVTVEFAGQKQSAKATADGKWMVSLSSLEASAEGRDMTITDWADLAPVLDAVSR